MTQRHRLPRREKVFIESLLYHGFRTTRRRKNLKYKRGYVIPATRMEDSGGIDFWIKMPRDTRLFPVQVTQRGVRLHRRRRKSPNESLEPIIRRAEAKIRSKRDACYRSGIAFVLVRDYDGSGTNPLLASHDVTALRYGISHLLRRP